VVTISLPEPKISKAVAQSPRRDTMEPSQSQSARKAEWERLRRELLRRIMASEARRQATRANRVKVGTPKT
jgi:hypothetical protein